jgi:hypothetical protein
MRRYAVRTDSGAASIVGECLGKKVASVYSGILFAGEQIEN